MGFIVGLVGFLILLFLFSKIWPLMLLGAGLVVAHAPKMLGIDWQDWEWGLVALAVVIQAALFGDRDKRNIKQPKA